jgi:hypothetical protein
MSDTLHVTMIRGALRQRHLPAVANQLDVTIPVLEAFASGANLAPGLLAGLAQLLAKCPAPQNIPAVPKGKIMRLTARAIKVTLVLDGKELADPGSPTRVTLQIVAGGRTVTADIAAKSVRKARALITEHGADQVAVLIQGKLDGSVVAEAGLVAQLKTPKVANTTTGNMEIAR